MKLGTTTSANLLHRRCSRHTMNSKSTNTICGCLLSAQNVIHSERSHTGLNRWTALLDAHLPAGIHVKESFRIGQVARPGSPVATRRRAPRDHHAGIQFASQSVRMTKVKTKIATPKMMSCPRINFGRSAALILIIAPPEHIEM
jgi:hypothetical protein